MDLKHFIKIIPVCLFVEACNLELCKLVTLLVRVSGGKKR